MASMVKEPETTSANPGEPRDDNMIYYDITQFKILYNNITLKYMSYVCMYVYIYIYMYTYIYTYIYRYIYIYIYIFHIPYSILYFASWRPSLGRDIHTRAHAQDSLLNKCVYQNSTAGSKTTQQQLIQNNGQQYSRKFV